ncbi:MAG: hypothetical protein M1816_003929, partial [Peltula sp. TS41687]
YVLEREMERTVQEVQLLGILHKDVRPQNVLWNEELGRAVLIDFEYVSLTPEDRGSTTVGVTPKKRKYNRDAVKQRESIFDRAEEIPY